MDTIWKIFARLPWHSEDTEDYAAECFRAGVIAVGWNEVGDLNKYSSRDELKERMGEIWAEEVRDVPQRLAQWAASLWHFRMSVRKGDIVICPDRNSGMVYVGRVRSDRPFHDKSPLEGKCSFAHRRKVRWLRALNHDEVRSIWKDGRFGGLQTVAQIRSGAEGLWRRIRAAHSQEPKVQRGNLRWHPDQEWGRAAELRALACLKERGKEPTDVSHLYRGWDIECGPEKIEVKGRKSSNTVVRLTNNEWMAAEKHRKNYTLLIFTAPTKTKLEAARPRHIPDPTRSQRWKKQQTVTYEYFMKE